jgi:hypothetical protein
VNYRIGKARLHAGWSGVAALLAAGTLGLAAIPAAAQTVGSDTFGCTTPPEDVLHLDVSNPGPGDKVPVGDMVIHGVAYDRSTMEDKSVDRVQLFLGTRGSGGTLLANATLGLPNPFAEPGGPRDMDGWDATISVPSSPGPSNIVVYAHSAVSDTESTVAVPIMIAQSSDPNAHCSSSTTAGTTATVSTIHLDLSNPQPNDSVLVGGLVVQGVAFDPEVSTGTGVDRVSFFLDDRNTGGQHLADAVPTSEPDLKHGFYQTTLSMPDLEGGHTLFVYAHSMDSGQETVLQVPISIKR